jgi:hypothetical protein
MSRGGRYLLEMKRLEVQDLESARDAAVFAAPDDFIDHDIEAMPVVIETEDGKRYTQYVSDEVVDGVVILKVSS